MTDEETSDTEVAVTEMALEAELDFGLNLLKQQPISESSVFSPLSIAFALALLHAGAKGDTKDQLRAATFNNGTDEEFIEYYQKLASGLLEKNELVEVNLANRLFLANDFTPFQSYLDSVSKNFGAQAEVLDFSDGQASAKAVNSFVNATTCGKITRLVEASLFKDALAILVNALYFKSNWQFVFSAQMNSQRDFESNANNSRKIDFMSQPRVRRLYYEDEKAQILTLKYKAVDYGFNIILPKERFGLEIFASELTAADLSRYLSSVESRLITLTIPKMKIEKEMGLKEALEKLGVTDIFTDSADFSEIAAGPLVVSDIKHKALIEVDEKGTVAAAASFVKMRLGAAAPVSDPIFFVADHPFLYCLTYKNHPLFMGVFA